MSGTTLCPHCGIRFKVTKAQLEVHHGMVRCGHCLQAFDTLPHFSPEEIDPQLELPILAETEITEALPPIERSISNVPSHAYTSAKKTVSPNDPELATTEDLSSFTSGTEEAAFLSKPRSRLWAFAAFALLLLLIAQAIFLFRVQLAAHFPDLKPGLVYFCRLLKCEVPLPRNDTLISIESSKLKDDPEHRNQVILSALLRNRALYAQTFPNLELTLTNVQDQAIARRIFKPKDYLPPSENETAGFPANMEISIMLHLDTTDLKPVGYRLELFYSNR